MLSFEFRWLLCLKSRNQLWLLLRLSQINLMDLLLADIGWHISMVFAILDQWSILYWTLALSLSRGAWTVAISDIEMHIISFLLFLPLFWSLHCILHPRRLVLFIKVPWCRFKMCTLQSVLLPNYLLNDSQPWMVRCLQQLELLFRQLVHSAFLAVTLKCAWVVCPGEDIFFPNQTTFAKDGQLHSIRQILDLRKSLGKHIQSLNSLAHTTALRGHLMQIGAFEDSISLW